MMLLLKIREKFSVQQLVWSVALIFFAVFTTWLVIKTSETPLAGHNQPDTLDSFMVNAHAAQMNQEDGTLQDELYSPVLVHFSLGDTTNLKSPHFIIYNTSGEPWHIYANYGQARNGIDSLQLWSNVRLEQAAGPNNDALRLTTSAATIYPREKQAVTQQPVALWQPSGTVHSVGAHADLNTGTIDLLSQARGHYQNQ